MGSGLHPRDGEFRGLGLEPRLAYDFSVFYSDPHLRELIYLLEEQDHA